MDFNTMIDLANALELNTERADEAQEILTSWVWEVQALEAERTEKVRAFAPSFQAGYDMFPMED